MEETSERKHWSRTLYSEELLSCYPLWKDGGAVVKNFIQWSVVFPVIPYGKREGQRDTPSHPHYIPEPKLTFWPQKETPLTALSLSLVSLFTFLFH